MGLLLKGNIAKIVIYDKWRVNGELTMTPLGHAGFSTHASSKVVILVNRDPARQNDNWFTLTTMRPIKLESPNQITGCMFGL